MKVLRDFPSAHFQQTPFSPNSKTVRLLNIDWSASLGVRFWCPGHLSCPPLLFVALRSLAAAVAYGPEAFGHGFHFFEFVSLSGYWCPSSLDICLLFVPGMISHPTGSEDFGSHPFVSPIV